MRRREFVAGWIGRAAAPWITRAAVAEDRPIPARQIHAGGADLGRRRARRDHPHLGRSGQVVARHHRGREPRRRRLLDRAQLRDARSPPTATSCSTAAPARWCCATAPATTPSTRSRTSCRSRIVAVTSTSIAVAPSLPVHSVKELIAYVKANPGKLSYGSGGVGAITHIAVELFKQQAGGLDLLHVPYRGMGPAMNDLFSRPARRRVPEHHVADDGAAPSRQAAHPGGERARAARSRARHPDRERGRAAGFRVADLLRLLRARRYAARRSSTRSTT